MTAESDVETVSLAPLPATKLALDRLTDQVRAFFPVLQNRIDPLLYPLWQSYHSSAQVHRRSPHFALPKRYLLLTW